MQDESRVRELLREGLSGDGPVVFLTGAGVSAESGIPTFRGEEGYWTIGSREYHPMELATNEAFSRHPDELWSWYLYRRGVCRAAQPNPAHAALVEAERALGRRFVLVTQNVDGLHLRAGNDRERTWQIHGCIDFMRCADECLEAPVPLPDTIPVDWPKTRRVGESERALLKCPDCGAPARPHVLWFDECYDEALYRWDSSIRAASEASLLVVAGTSGATNLPLQMAGIAVRRRIPFLVVNREPSAFSEMVEGLESGLFLQGEAGRILPQVVAAMNEAR